MILYKCDVATVKKKGNDLGLFLDQSKKKEKRTKPFIFQRDRRLRKEKDVIKYNFILNEANRLAITDNPNIITVGINFDANRRNVKVIKGHSILSVFGNNFMINENYIKIIGNYNVNKYSPKIPLIHIVVENFSEDRPKYESIMYYLSETKDFLRIVKRPYTNEPKGRFTVTFYQKDKDTVYLTPGQFIVSDLPSEDAVWNRIGREPMLHLKIHLIGTFDPKDEDSIVQAIERDFNLIPIESSKRYMEKNMIIVSDSIKREHFKTVLP